MAAHTPGPWRFVYQRGSTQVFRHGRMYGMYTVCSSDGRARWLQFGVGTTKAQAIMLAEHYEASR